MTRTNHSITMNELSASEGVFTAAQANRLGITRAALSKAVSSGRAERIMHGAYRLTSTQSSLTDEIAAAWKLTNPAKFTHERSYEWDGIAVGGTSAAFLLGIGNFHLSPYRIYAPQRINSRSRCARFGIRNIAREDVTWIYGMPVTRAERTLVDLYIDREDPSLIADAFADAARNDMDFGRLRNLARESDCAPRDSGALAFVDALIAMHPVGKKEMGL